jgi:nitrogen fixation protein FixH
MGNPNAVLVADFARRRWWIWPAIISGMLLLHFVGMMWAIAIAKSDQSFKVVKNAYRDGLQYDQFKAQVAESNRLGWNATIRVGDELDDAGRRELRVRLIDRDGRPLTDVDAVLSFFHEAAGNDTRTVVLSPADAGDFVGRTDLARGGFWTINLQASRGNQHFIQQQVSRYVNPARKP